MITIIVTAILSLPLALNCCTLQHENKAKVMHMAMAHVLSRAVYTAAQLKIADEITDIPTSVHEIATRLGCDTHSLYRLLRMLSSHGIFYEVSPHHFIATPLSTCLESTGSNSVRDTILGEDMSRWNAVGALDQAVIQGKPAFDLLHGTNYFEYIAQRPDLSQRFDAHMNNLTQEEDVVLSSEVNISANSIVVDIGGGRGKFLAHLLRKNPETSGILFDLATVVSNTENLAIDEVQNRCQVIAGSFFDAWPANGTVYLLKRVLHDWNDEDCEKILAHCRACLTGTNKLYIIDAIVPNDNNPHMSKDIDVFMMAVFAGRERTLHEFETLLAQQGLEIVSVQASKTGLSIIEIALPPHKSNIAL